MKKLILIFLLFASAIVANAQCSTVTTSIQSYLTPVAPSGTYNKVYTAKVYFTPVEGAVNVALFNADPNKQYVQVNDWCAAFINGVLTYTNCLPQGYMTISPGSIPYNMATNSFSADLLFRATDINGARICEVPFTLTIPAAESFCTKLVIGGGVMENPDYTKNQVIVEWYCANGTSYDIAVTGPSGTQTTTVGNVGYTILTLNYATAYTIVVTGHFADSKTLVSDTMSVTTGAAPVPIKPAPGTKPKPGRK